MILLTWSFSLVTDDSADISTCYSHTKGHISYYVTGKEEENPAVFTGDTLVSGDEIWMDTHANEIYEEFHISHTNPQHFCLMS